MKKNLRTAFSTRQYMLLKDFEIYYYNDHDISKVNAHSHDYYEFYLFLEGEVSMDIDGTSYPLKSGDVILIPPGIPHHAMIDKSTPYRRFVFWISQNFYQRLAATDPDYVYLMRQVPVTRRFIYHYDVYSFNSLQYKVFRLIEEMQSEKYGKDAMIAIEVHDLILYLNRYAYEQEYPKTQREEQSLCANLTAYIEDNLDGDLSLSRLAKEFFVSKYHIAHVFKDTLGISIHQFITKRRLAMCRDALLGQQKLNEICLTYGFQDYSSFFRAFKKEFGLSPSEYRELFRKDESELLSQPGTPQ